MATAVWRSAWVAAGRRWLGLAGVLVIAGSLTWLAGLPGLLVGLLVGVLWFSVPVPYVVAAGHVAVLWISGDPALGPAITLEVGFLAILGATILGRRSAPRRLTLLGLLGLLLGALAWVGWHVWDTRWLAGLAVVSLIALGLYGMHRLAVVTVELQAVDQGA